MVINRARHLEDSMKAYLAWNKAIRLTMKPRIEYVGEAGYDAGNLLKTISLDCIILSSFNKAGCCVAGLSRTLKSSLIHRLDSSNYRKTLECSTQMFYLG